MIGEEKLSVGAAILAQRRCVDECILVEREARARRVAALTALNHLECAGGRGEAARRAEPSSTKAQIVVMGGGILCWPHTRTHTHTGGVGAAACCR